MTVRELLKEGKDVAEEAFSTFWGHKVLRWASIAGLAAALFMPSSDTETVGAWTVKGEGTGLRGYLIPVVTEARYDHPDVYGDEMRCQWKGGSVSISKRYGLDSPVVGVYQRYLSGSRDFPSGKSKKEIYNRCARVAERAGMRVPEPRE